MCPFSASWKFALNAYYICGSGVARRFQACTNWTFSTQRHVGLDSLGEVIDVYLYLLQYKKPPQVIEMEQRVMEELKSVAAIKDDQCKPSWIGYITFTYTAAIFGKLCLNASSSTCTSMSMCCNWKHSFKALIRRINSLILQLCIITFSNNKKWCKY